MNSQLSRLVQNFMYHYLLYKIKGIASNTIERGCLRKLTKLDPSDKNIVILTMKAFMESQNFPYASIDVKSHLKSNLDIFTFNIEILKLNVEITMPVSQFF